MLFIAGALAITAAFCVIYVSVLYRWDVPGTRPYWGLVTLVALAAIACIVYGNGATALWIYVSAAAGLVIAERSLALRAVAAVVACYVLFSFTSHDSMTDFLITLLPTALVGFAMVGFRQQIVLMGELAQARETVAKLAANEERLRLARDMHDLTGQSLSMITLKSELAAKLLGRLPEEADRDRAREQIDDIARVSRQALHDIREAVSGYRRPTLAIEIITARTALDAARIELDDDPQLTMLSGTFDAEAEAALAWCLREAVTNVVRHSGARHCTVRLSRHGEDMSLEVTDDGRGFRPGTHQDPGAGLRGMSERLDAVSGTLVLGAAASEPTAAARRGFRLTATVRAAPNAPTAPDAARPAAGRAGTLA